MDDYFWQIYRVPSQARLDLAENCSEQIRQENTDEPPI